MTEPIDPSVSTRMSNTRGRDTAPELEIRRLLHSHGYRYRVNSRPVPDLRRTADVIFTRAKVAVLVDGCFWHGCPEHYVEPKTRTEFWAAKIAGNVARDAETNRSLERSGWTVLRFWEHQPAIQVAEQIMRVVDASR